MNDHPPQPIPLPISPHRPAPYDGPSRAEILHLRQAHVSPGVFTYYAEPLCIVEGHMQYLWDQTGRQYLDAFGGIVTISVGHCHPLVTQRLREQVGKLVHCTTIYAHPAMPQLAARLAQTLPPNSQLTTSYFLNSGNEANEVALLLARLHTGRHEVLALQNAYHGGSQATMGLTAVGTWKFPIASPSGVTHLPAPYCYRCPLGLSYPSCDIRCARAAEDVIRYQTSGEVAAVIAETVQGVGGVVVPPPEYFPMLYEIARRYGALCIADEVQTAWGRSGSHYWGFERWGVTPDLVTTAKGIANGFPLSACITRSEIAAHLKRRVHFNTFAGNPLAMVAGMATLEAIEADGIQARAAALGTRLLHGLLALQDRHACIGEVRGFGLMLGVELVADRLSKAPATALAAAVLEACRRRSLLIGRGGLFGNVLRITPPMCLNEADCEFLLDCLDRAIAEAQQT